MSAFIHEAGLARSEGVAAVANAFALAGYARYVLLLEILAASPGPVCMSYDAWAIELHSDDESVREFMQFCQEQGLLVVDDSNETLNVHSPVIKRYDPSQAVEPPSDNTLYTRSEQWAEWFINDLAYLPRETQKPENIRFFARWCASRVTVGDMSDAVEAATAQGTGITPPALHKHLQALRNKRLQEANECF